MTISYAHAPLAPQLQPEITRELAMSQTRGQTSSEEATGSSNQAPFPLPAIFDSTLDLILVVNRDGTVTYANARLTELTGNEPAAIVGQALLKLIPDGERQAVEQHWKAVRAGEARVFETQFRRNQDGHIFCLVAASSILDTDLYLFIVHDLTEAKNMQVQLLQAEKSAALGRLVAGAAHELNNPLTAVLGFAQILREESQDEMMQQDLDRIIRGALRARRVVQDLLAFARQQSPVRSDTDLNQTLQEAAESIAHRAHRSGVALEVRLEPALPPLWANAQQLKLVWDNILTNACQAMAPLGGGRLDVISERSGDHVRVTIADTGPGIPRAQISQIFDPFFTTKAVGEGVGLGLSLCQGIVESHGGQVWVESTEGEGAAFVIELPVPEEKADSQPTGPAGRPTNH